MTKLRKSVLLNDFSESEISHYVSAAAGLPPRPFYRGFISGPRWGT